MSTEQFATLQQGDLVETASLFPNMCKDKVVLHTQAVTDPNKREFIVTWMGVTLDRWTFALKGSQVERVV